MDARGTRRELPIPSAAMTHDVEDHVMLRCRGGSTPVGAVPPFELREKDFICLHVLREYSAERERQLVDSLAHTQMSSRAVEISLATPVSAESGKALGLTDRSLLSLEEAASRVPIVVFSTAGLDPLGAQRMYERARALLTTERAFIHLSYAPVGSCDASPFARCIT
jgi:hypothetical protein